MDSSTRPGIDGASTLVATAPPDPPEPPPVDPPPLEPPVLPESPPAGVVLVGGDRCVVGCLGRVHRGDVRTDDAGGVRGAGTVRASLAACSAATAAARACFSPSPARS